MHFHAVAGEGRGRPEHRHALQVEKMEKAVEAVKRNFGTIRTGRANPAMLDRIQVRKRCRAPARARQSPDTSQSQIQPQSHVLLKSTRPAKEYRQRRKGCF